MKLSKKKVTALALVVCLIATLSFGSLAWFTDDDSVTNDFMIAGSDKDDPEDIFSVDVWEGTDPENPEQEGLTYEKILPGDTLSKVAHVKNTGSYDQYVRVKITVSDAKVWQKVYKANMIPVTEFVDVDLNKVYEGKVGSYLDEENDSFVYYLYYNNILPLDDETTPTVDESDMIVFTEAYVSGHLTKEQAWDMTEDGFQISVQADAVQTENVGENVYEAFKTVGMLDETNAVNTTFVADETELKAALAEDGYVVLVYEEPVKLEENYEITNTVNIYLNERTLDTTRKNANNYGLKITGDVTIGGYGLVNLDGERGIYLNGDLSIYGGSFVDDYPTSSADEAMINVYEAGALNIYGGEFVGQEYCVHVRNGNGTADIYGGEFETNVEGGPIFNNKVSDHRPQP